ncbi:MAG: ribose 5-phosphate isomerase B [Bacteroidales bacterium]|nr:ribose 5-phosphate isomerase B [Bacteroidales bacterium]MCF8334735.1 ribose 5-phosphate isomerase B [Bacteroidales bacterium]
MYDKDKIILIGSDHGGFEVKQHIVGKLEAEGYKVKDYGTDSEESVDYPDYIHPVAHGINTGQYERGIILCGSGNGAQMTANKYRYVRAGLAWNNEIAKLARQHNDANILALPGRFISKEDAWQLVLTFLETDFEGERHQRRVEKMDNIKH